MSLIPAPAQRPVVVSGRPMSAANQTAFDPWIVWVAFRRAWWWATPLGVMLSVAVAYYVFSTFVPMYQASHLLEANRDYVIFQGVLQGPTDLIRSERPLVLNHLVLSSVLADPKIAESPSLVDPATREQNIRSGLSINDAGSRTLMQISFRDSNPVTAAYVANAVAKSYLEQRQRFDDRRIKDLEGWLQPALKMWEDEVEQHRKRIVTLSQQAKGFNPFQELSRLKADTGYFTGLRDELTSVRSSEAVIKAELEMLRDSMDGRSDQKGAEPNSEELEKMLASLPGIFSISGLIAEKKNEMRQMERNDLVRIRRDWYDNLAAEVERLEVDLEKAREAARPEVIDRWKKRSAEIASSQQMAQLRQKEEELANLETRLKVLNLNYEEEEKRLAKFAGESAELYFAQQKYMQSQNILEKLNDRVASLRTERQKSSTIQTLAEAVAPTSPMEQIPWKKMFMFAGGAFMVPFGLALLWEMKTRRVTTAESLSAGRDLPVVGEVARLPTGNKSGKQQRVYEESIESVRANLMFSKGIENLHTIVVASSMSGEGKSSLASHLALSLARATGNAVLLIDADMRSPDQHHLFGLDLGVGLSGVLAGKIRLEQAIDRSLGGRLHVLTAGRLEGSPHRLATPEKVEVLLSEAKKTYRYIVIDTAPVLAASETLAFSSVADATLVCVMRDQSRQDHLKRCLNRLQAAGSNIVGTIFNGVSTAQYYYRYGNYHYTLPSSVKD